MSYTIWTVAQTHTDLDKMLAFMNTNFTPVMTLWPYLLREDPDNCMPTPQTGDALFNPAASPLGIGYHYNAGWEPEERNYAYGLVRWMALKIGKKTRKGAQYHYEDERVTVIVASEHPEGKDGWNQPWDLVDEVGFTPCHRLSASELAEMETEASGEGKDAEYAAFKLRGARSDPAIRAELKRLDALWLALLEKSAPLRS